MTDKERFTQVMAVMMGRCLHESDIQDFYDDLKMVPRCKYCGKYFTEQWSPITESDWLTEEVVRWWMKEMPDEWRKYVESTWKECIKQTFGGEVLEIILFYGTLLAWMQENRGWNRKECLYCDNGNVSLDEKIKLNPEYVTHFDCDYCHGSGTIPRWPEVEKILEEK